MHLGRFHATIYDLHVHFKSADISTRLQEAASLLEQFGQTRQGEQKQAFKEKIAEILEVASITDDDLEQPQARQILNDLDLDELMPPTFRAIASNLMIFQ